MHFSKILPLCLFVAFYTNKTTAQCISDTNALIVSQNATWSTQQVMPSDVFISAGVELRLTGTLELYAHGNIYIDRGASLIIDGGTITRASCTESWGGIQVYGNSLMPQTSNYQGTLEIKNGGTLSYANTAINNSAYKCGFVWDKMGGIIYATNGVFYNNLRDVQFGAYSYTAGGLTADYKAQFVRCEFKKDVLFPFTTTMSNISMWGVYGVAFRGCDFVYQDTSVFSNKISMGIVANDATFTLTKNDQQASTFTGYDRTVFCINAQRADKVTTIEHSAFKPKGIGLAMVACSHFEISHNTFELAPRLAHHERITPDPNPAPIGYQPGGVIFIKSLVLDACADFDVHDNEFSGLVTNYNNSNFIGITNCYMGVNRIYKNKLSNSFIHTAAIEAFGKNQSAGGTEGVFIKCNEFVNNVEDIRVFAVANWHKPAAQRGIPETQGSWDDNQPDAKDLANNLFSLTSVSQTPPPFTVSKKRDVLVVDQPTAGFVSNYVVYTHADNIPEFTPLPDPNWVYGNMALRTINGLNVNYENACPSPPLAGQVNLNAQRAALALLDKDLEGLTGTIVTTLDAGNSDLLEAEIRSALPDDYPALYVSLMDMAPFVSLRNLLNVVSLPQFPPYQLKNLLLANPHGYRSAEVREALAGLELPLPAAYLSEMAEAQALTTAYDALKARLTTLKQKQAAAVRNIVRYHNLQPTTEFDLQAFLLNRKEPHYHYAAVEALVARGEVETARSVLEQVGALPRMDAHARAEWASLKEYYDIVFTAGADQRKADKLDTAEEALLRDMYLKGNFIAAKKALGLLMLNNDTYGYMGYVSPEENSYKTAVALGRDHPAIKENWTLFPNPAKNHAVLRWKEALPPQTTLHIEVCNMAGQCVLKESLPANHHSHVLPTADWAEGLYTLRISSSRGVHSLQKLMVQR